MLVYTRKMTYYWPVTGLQAVEQLSVNNDNRLRRFGAIVLLFLLGYWSYQLLKPYPVGQTPWIFLDYLNLLIHEAGHWIWMPFGQIWAIAGGSITQILFPILIVIAFIRQRDLLGVSFGFFWVGNNLINISYYIADAQAQSLPLLGGDSTIHDWNWLLQHFNLLDSSQLISSGFMFFGIGLLLTSIGALVLAVLTMKTNRVYV